MLPRSTLIVRGIEKSLTLYRDSIGMTLIYDQIIQRNGKEIRLIFLKTTEDLVGVLGLVDYEYSNPDAEVKKNLSVKKALHLKIRFSCLILAT